MKVLRGQTVLLTGASGGLGQFMTHAFAERGVNLALVAFPGTELEPLRATIEKRGCRAISLTLDLRDPVQRRDLLAAVRKELGPIDILVNNAGVEYTSAYHELPEASIADILDVNLEAPMVLTRLALPEMLERKRGHVVNISSLAGKSGPAFQEPYAATKAALVAFTLSLRSSYHGSGVSASVVTPGFVEAGIYADLKRRAGREAPWMLGTSPPQRVARAVLRVIERDLPEAIVNPIPVRPLLALTALMPRAGEWISRHCGANEFFRDVVEAEKSGRS